MEKEYVTVEKVNELDKKEIKAILEEVNVETKGLNVNELRELLEEKIIDGLEVMIEKELDEEPEEETPTEPEEVNEEETPKNDYSFQEVTKSFFAEVEGGREYHAINDVIKVTPAFERKYKDFLKVSTEAAFLEFEEGKSCPK